MLKQILFSLLLGCLGMQCLCFGGEQEGAAPVLKLTVSSDDGNVLTNGLKHLRVTFTNVSTNQVRILREFREKEILDVWFYVTAKDAEYQSVKSARGLKVQLRHKLEYVSLDPNESFGVQLQMSDLKLNLASGAYTVTLAYRNQYGDNCFKGYIESNTIELTVK